MKKYSFLLISLLIPIVGINASTYTKGMIQTIPNEKFQVAFYAEGGEGVAYHDENSSDFERAGLGYTTNVYGEPLSNLDGINSPNCNAGYQYSLSDYSFREGECVDVYECYGLDGGFTDYNLSSIEAGEWLVYDVEVKEPGYYKLQYLSTVTTYGNVDFSIETENGRESIIYNYVTGEPFSGSVSFKPYKCKDVDVWKCWQWKTLASTGDKYPALLFKKAGVYRFVISFLESFGDLGPLSFTKIRSFGTDEPFEIEEEEEEGVFVVEGTEEIMESEIAMSIPTNGPYNNITQQIPNDEFQVAFYDEGGEGVAYHDRNSSDFERYALGYTTNINGLPIESLDTFNHPADCNAAYQYSLPDYSFRDGECVDVFSSYGIKGDYSEYCLGHVEQAEWLTYTVDVKEPGYYTIQYLAGVNTMGSFTMLNCASGNIFRNNIYNYETEEPYKGSMKLMTNDDCENEETWKCWKWNDVIAEDDENPAVLFKQAGIQKIRLLFLDYCNDFGAMKFTKVKDYIPVTLNSPRMAELSENVNVTQNEMFTIYPNPAEESFMIVSPDNRDNVSLSIFNLLGQQVCSIVFSGSVTIDEKFAAGTYIVELKSDNRVERKELIIK